MYIECERCSSETWNMSLQQFVTTQTTHINYERRPPKDKVISYCYRLLDTRLSRSNVENVKARNISHYLSVSNSLKTAPTMWSSKSCQMRIFWPCFRLYLFAYLDNGHIKCEGKKPPFFWSNIETRNVDMRKKEITKNINNHNTEQRIHTTNCNPNT